jgi:hypothetical protein
MKIIWVSIFFLCLLILGCGTNIKQLIPNETEQVAFDPFKIELGYDIYCLRIDINRQYVTSTKETTDPKGNVESETVMTPKPYHYIGIYIGNGIFIDANLNISLNIMRFFNLEEKNHVVITAKTSQLFSPETRFEKKGNIVTIRQPGFMSMPEERRITLADKGAHFEGGFFLGEQDIIIGDDEITYDPHAIIRDWYLTRVIKTEHGAKIPGFWSDYEITKNEDGSVTLGKYLLMTIEGNKMILTITDFFGFSRKYTIIKSPSRMVFYKEDFTGFTVDISDTKIVEKANGIETTYSIQTSE